MKTLASLPDRAVILFQGDSITDAGRYRQVQDLPNDLGAIGCGYPQLAAASILADYPAKKFQIFNRGIGGNRIVDLYARIREDILNLKPQLLSILIGVNDTWHHFERNTGVPVDKFTRVYRSLLQEVRDELPSINFVLCEPFLLNCGVAREAWFIEIEQRRAAVRQLAKEFSAIFVPFHEVLTDATKAAPPDYWATDGVHPTPAGHELMARAWLKATSA